MKKPYTNNILRGATLEQFGFPPDSGITIFTEYLGVRYREDTMYNLYWRYLIDHATSISDMALGEDAVIPYIFCRDVTGQYLFRVRLDYMDCDGVNFKHTHIEGSSFEGTCLTGADFFIAVIEGTTFLAADLEGATFGGVVAKQCDFRLANLCNAILPSTVIDCKFKGAVYDNRTVFPVGFDPVVERMTKIK